MIRHENHFLLLIHQHEIFDVLPSNFKFIVTERQEGLMHVVWIGHRDLRDFLSFDDKAHMSAKRRTIIKSSRLVRIISKMCSNRRKNTSAGDVSTQPMPGGTRTA